MGLRRRATLWWRYGGVAERLVPLGRTVMAWVAIGGILAATVLLFDAMSALAGLSLDTAGARFGIAMALFALAAAADRLSVPPQERRWSLLAPLYFAIEHAVVVLFVIVGLAAWATAMVAAAIITAGALTS